MAEAERRSAAVRRLRAGHTYFDMDHPERGPFVASGDEILRPEANVVDQNSVDEVSWNSLLAEGWGDLQSGAGHQSYDQGAFGQEEDPRTDTLNAAPPGVGEGLTPRREGENRRR